MSRFWMLLCAALILEMVCNAEGAKKKVGRRPKKAKPGDMMNQLSSLQKNVSTLWSEVKEMGSSRVNVHVHGMDEDPSDVHDDHNGTHVHIHMHMDHPMMGMHKKHHGGMSGDHDDHDHGDHEGHDEDETVHGFHGMPTKKMMKFMHQHMHFPKSPDDYVYGHCEMAMNPTVTKSQHNIKGAVHFRQKMNGVLEMLIHLKGFHVPKKSNHDDHAHTHGFHVHEFGDLSNGCQSFGGHYDPDHVEHSGKSSDSRHAGDWGNIVCDEQGEVHKTTSDTMVSLMGTHSIVGRGIVIHMEADDLGEGGVQASKKTGNAGGRMACCVVAWADEHDWNMLAKHAH